MQTVIKNKLANDVSFEERATLQQYIPTKNREVKHKTSFDLLATLSGAMHSDNVNKTNRHISLGYSFLSRFVNNDLFSPAEYKENLGKLNLSSLYGNGPDHNPELYQKHNRLKLRLSNVNYPMPVGLKFLDYDLPRDEDGKASPINNGNFYNLIQTQLHVTLIKFHNELVDKYIRSHACLSQSALFDLVKSEVIRHYQWMIVHDFLKTICDPTIVEAVFDTTQKSISGYDSNQDSLSNELRFAALEIIQTLNATTFDYNNFLPQVDFEFTCKTLYQEMTGNRIIDWTKFFEFKTTCQETKLNYCNTISTNFYSDTKNEEITLWEETKRLKLLSLFEIGQQLDFSSGQDLARRFGIDNLSPEELLAGNADAQNEILLQNNGYLLKETPLWYYLIRESQSQNEGKHLGKLGSYIAANAFVQILQKDKDSIVNHPSWQPNVGKEIGQFYITDLIEFAQMKSINGVNCEDADMYSIENLDYVFKYQDLCFEVK